VTRVAAARHIGAEQIRSLAASIHTEQPGLGFLGEPRVSVLLSNLNLDQKFSLHGK